MDITSTFRTAVQRYQNSEKLALQNGEKDAKLLSRKPALWKERKGKQSSFSKAALQIVGDKTTEIVSFQLILDHLISLVV